MAKGGFRASAGRPKSPTSRRSLVAKAKRPEPAEEQVQEIPAQPESLDPLSYMLRVMNDPTAEPERRDRLAIAAAPFVHPRANEAKKGKKEELADAARAAASGRFAAPPPPRLCS
jgi:hypothetical protein